MRWLMVLAVLLGAAAGFAWPRSSSAGTGYWYQAAISPPPAVSGTKVWLTCGWHTSYCDTWGENGPNLDWDVGTDSFYVYFRGWFTRSNSPRESNRLYTYVFQYRHGDDVCDETVVDVYERYNNKLRFGMHYLHSYAFPWMRGNFNLYTSANHEYNNLWVGMATWDYGCTGDWYHVHDFWASVNVPAPVRNTTDIDHYGLYAPLEDYQNNATWTRWMGWEEGS